MNEQDKLQPLATNDELLASKILIIREQKVMLDRDLAELYGVETRVLKQGVAMLSTVLKSKQGIQTNIQIMRIFTRIRQMVIDNTEVWKEIADIRVDAVKYNLQ